MGILSLFGALLFTCPCLVVPAPSYTDALKVVVNLGVRTASLPRNTARAIFGMRLREWPDGTPVRVFVLRDDSPIHVLFSKEKLHVFPYQIRQTWDRLVYSGTGQAPVQVDSEEAMRIRVATTAGAIGYLPQALIDDRVHVLRIW